MFLRFNGFLLNVDLSNVNFTGADMTGANLTDAKLTGTVFRDIKGKDSLIGLDKARDSKNAVFD